MKAVKHKEPEIHITTNLKGQMFAEYSYILSNGGLMSIIMQFFQDLVDVKKRPENPMVVLMSQIKPKSPDMKKVHKDLTKIRFEEFLLKEENAKLKLLIAIMRDEDFLKERYQGSDGDSEETQEEEEEEEGGNRELEEPEKKEDLTKPIKKTRFKLGQ